MARHLDEIRERRSLDQEARTRVDATKRAMRLQVALVKLREGRGMSQAGVAEELGTSRPNVSRIESEVDVRLSTVERYVESLGGRLEIHAVFDDEAVKLSGSFVPAAGSSQLACSHCSISGRRNRHARPTRWPGRCPRRARS
jgi:transcriptional regulator with XRE-family HTH domain